MSIIRNVLPGEQGETKWFDRLNEFERAETIRQVQFKRKHWPQLPDGLWSKSRTRSYPHILPEGEIAKALFGGIADEVLRYCETEDIAIHTEALNLRSSQICCFNVLFPLKRDLALASPALADVLPGVTQVTEIEFEYTGLDGATEWLGEPEGGKRGQNRTSIDAAVRWQRGDQRVLTLCEWKYTERAYGTCGGFASTGNSSKYHCLGIRDDPYGYASDCYLTHGRNHRRYWSLFAQAGIDLSALDEGMGCPLRGPFYQLARQYLVAAHEMLRNPRLEVQVASLSFRENSSLHGSSSAGITVEDRWNSCLRKPEQSLRTIHVESIIDRARAAAGDQHQPWLAYLNDRYGL